MTSVATRDHDDSGEYSDASQDNERTHSGNEDNQHESDYDSQGSDSDQSDRDPENQETERRVDDDEDRSNPQYIPKKGTFYEHDDRTAASGEESSNTTSEAVSEKKEGSEAPVERRRPPRKSDVINKWSHDKYNENEQMPKSRDELVSIYGYDIRNEDAPPHARRNRRYGRGPNKYTRTWEDEDAYRRQAAAQQQTRKPPNPEDFPELDAAGRKPRKPRAPRPRSKSQPTSNESLEIGSQLRRNASIKNTKGKNERPARASMNRQVKAAPKEKLPPLENLTITTTVNNNNNIPSPAARRVNATVAQQRPVPTDQSRRKPQPTPQPNNNTAPAPKPSVQQPTQKPQQNQTQQQTAPNTESRGGSKRYSSLRQRPLADSYTPQQQAPPPQQQQPPQQMRYAGVPEYPAGGQPAPHQGSPGPQMLPNQQQQQPQVHRPSGPSPHGPSPPHQQLPQQHSQQVRLGILDQQQLVPHPHPHPIHNMPQPHPIVPGQMPPSQGYAPPAMMPAQYMQGATSAGNGGVFGGAVYAPPPQPYPMFPHHNYATQAGGVTYYNCAEQEPLPRAQRRPTAAIPIVRPAPDRQANSTEKDNIDRIVENMFVRKPWPATHGADPKLQAENRNSQEPQSKDSSQSNSLTSSSISTDSKPSEIREERSEERTEEKKEVEKKSTEEVQESVDA